MAYNFERFCCIFLFVCEFILQPVESFHSQTFNGQYFSSYEFKTIRVQDWFGCTSRCSEELSCISYNYKNNGKICILNNHGIEDFSRPEVQLLDHETWIFHQIRPVVKVTNKTPMKGPCPCNCGSSNQCYPKEPGLGDIPTKPAESCKKILDLRKDIDDLKDGKYYLKDGVESFPVYCQMTPIAGCDDVYGGGWTLVMKINGSQSTFQYDDKKWTSIFPYQEENGEDLSQKETKLQTFRSVSFTQMCVGMTTNSTPIKWTKIDFKTNQPNQLFPIITEASNPAIETESFKLEKWKKLLSGADMDSSCSSGFNQISSHSKAKARIGVIDTESYIGFGTGGTENRKMISCGNVYQNNIVPAFCFIMVR